MQQSFKFKNSTLVWVLLWVVVILSVVGLTWNVYNLIYFMNAGIIKVISYSLLVLATLTLTIIVFSVIFFGRYTIKNGEFATHMGIFKSKTPVDEVMQITLFKKSNKLVVYFLDGKYSVLLIAPEFYDAFVLAMREQNKKIIYDTQIEGEDLPS